MKPVRNQRKNASETKTPLSNGVNPFRKDFPILSRKISGKPLVYLDTAATAQKPQVVLDAIMDFYTRYNANIHRGIHTLSVEATDAVQHARELTAKLIGADSSELVFTSGTTMGINALAYTWAEHNLQDGDEILLSMMEHHANTVPWLELAKRKRIKLQWVPLMKDFKLDYDAMRKMVSKKTKLVSLAHISNVLGVENDIHEIVKIARTVGAKVLIDAAQGVPRQKINVHDWDIDFLVFSGHKMYGPTGIGGLYIRRSLIKSIPPFITGGGAILEVTHEKVTYQDPPEGFEAGTPHIAGMIGLGAAAQYIMDKGIENMRKTEHEVASYAYEQLSKIKGLKLFCNPDTNGVLPFVMEGTHPHDIADILNRHGVAIRAGFHCAMPLHTYLGIPATARISLGCYSTPEEIDIAVIALKDVQKMFA